MTGNVTFVKIVYIRVIHFENVAVPAFRRRFYRHGGRNMTITISSSSGDPIYLQIVNQIKSQILDGTLAAGEALPSMRNLATELRISFMTTKRAYEELERDGFIESFTGKGSFVKAQNMQLYREEQLRRMEQALAEVCESARKAGVTIQELHEMLDYINGGDYE